MPVLLRRVPSRLLWLALASLFVGAGLEATVARTGFHWMLSLSTLTAITLMFSAMVVNATARPGLVVLSLIALPQLMLLAYPGLLLIAESPGGAGPGWGLIALGLGCVATAASPVPSEVRATAAGQSGVAQPHST